MWLLMVGWVASALVFSTFFMKTMLRLRIVAIASNLAFMCYALLGLVYGDFGRLYPIFVLHAALLPLNASRLHQIRKTVTAVTDSTSAQPIGAQAEGGQPPSASSRLRLAYSSSFNSPRS